MHTYSQPWETPISLPTGDTPLEAITFSIVDTETCGIWRGARMVELGLLQIRGGEQLLRRSWLVNPETPIPPEAGRVHGISDGEVAGKPTAREVLREFLPLVQDTILVAHNAPYDEGILSTAGARYGLHLPPLPILDTIPLAKSLISGMDSYSLAHLSKTLGFEAQHYHRALADATTTWHLLSRCIHALGALHDANFQHLVTYGALSRLGDSASPLTQSPSRWPLLRLAVSTQAEMEIVYRKDSTPIRIPATLVAAFTHRGHSYLEIRDHRHSKEIRSLRMDRLISMSPIS